MQKLKDLFFGKNDIENSEEEKKNVDNGDRLVDKIHDYQVISNKIKSQVQWYRLDSEKKEEAYSEKENTLIEKAYLIGAIRVELNNGYFIDLFRMQQISKKDLSKQRPVIRKFRNEDLQKEQINGKPRDERFYVQEDYKNINILELSKQAVLTKPDFFLTPPIIKNWYLRTIEIYHDLSYIQKIRCIILLAIIGIENMGVLLNKDVEVKELVKYLNTDLEEDAKKSDEEINKNRREYSLWRAVDLPLEILDLYDKKKVPFFIWFAFTSTSSNKNIAEKKCENGKMNTIFEIMVDKTIFSPTVSIKEFSKYKNEDEIILQAASVLEVIDRKNSTSCAC